ncbi:hypothetical protein BIV60_04690 [Bacillus sp. MUM 116]|nr:hypothetical protein BIV60_04690 [Bacillus sp. MUM 116]
MKKVGKVAAVMMTSMLVLSACNTTNLKLEKTANRTAQTNVSSNHDNMANMGNMKHGKYVNENTILPTQKNINEKATPVKIERIGEHEVNVTMTSTVTDVQVAPDVLYKAWTYNGQAPGPVVIVNKGDTIHFTLENHDPTVMHSMDFHAVHTSPTKNFADVKTNDKGTFTYKASDVGVFMYHCGTAPVMMHIANGMVGTIIVKDHAHPYPNKVDKEYVVINNEWFDSGNSEDMKQGNPSHYTMSVRELANGKFGDTPFVAKVGDKVRLYFENVGMSQPVSFHVVGTVFDDVYLDGNPYNHLKGMQSVMIPASGGAVVEFTVVDEGTYSVLSHQFDQAMKGSLAKLIVTKDGKLPAQPAAAKH